MVEEKREGDDDDVVLSGSSDVFLDTKRRIWVIL